MIAVLKKESERESGKGKKVIEQGTNSWCPYQRVPIFQLLKILAPYFIPNLKYNPQIPHSGSFPFPLLQNPIQHFPLIAHFFLPLYPQTKTQRLFLPPSLFSLNLYQKKERKQTKNTKQRLMAQKRDKEETELKVPENLPICSPPQTIAPPPTHIPTARLPESSDPELAVAPEARSGFAAAAAPQKPDLEKRGALKRPREKEVSRCSGSGCRKRIGLMGFRCKCGDVFCSEHRYSDRHECSYDYKAAGREAIAKDNPVIRAAKLLKVWPAG